MTTVITKPDRRKGLRMSEPCKYETDIALMAKGIKDIEAGQERHFDKLYKVLEGNGGIGLITQTALNKTSLSRAWYFIAFLAVVIVGAAVKTLL